MLKRIFDFVLALLLLSILLFPFCILCLLIKILDPGPVLYWSSRVGRYNKLFQMPKLRTMKVDTPQVATHLMQDSASYLIPYGSLIRKLSLDEIPQLWSILKGDMSFVGPRPALFNQDDLVKLRTDRGIEKLVPGLTGYAQINGRDEIPIPQKVDLDYYYLQNQSFVFDLKIILNTFIQVALKKNVSH